MTSKTPALRRNLLLLYGAELLAKLVAMTVFAFLGRTLGDAGMGGLEFALATVFLLNLVLEAGLGPFAARAAAQDPDGMDALASRVTALRLGILAVDALVLAGLAALLERPLDDRLLLLAYGAVLVPAAFDLNWSFQARDRMGVVALGSLLRQLVLATVVFALVRSAAQVWLVPCGDALGLGAAVLVQHALFRRDGGRVRPIALRHGALGLARESFPLALSSLAWALRLFFPVIAVYLYRPPADAGDFGGAHRLFTAAHTFVWLYFFNLLPSFARAAQSEDRAGWRALVEPSLARVGWLVGAGVLVGAPLAPWLLPAIYGADYADAGTAFAILLGVLAIAFLSGHHRFSLIAWRRQREECHASLAGAVVSVGGCLALGAELTPEAAAWVLLSAEATTFLLALLAVARRIGSPGTATALRRPVLVTALLAGGALALGGRLGAFPTAALGGLGALLGLLVLDRSRIRRRAPDPPPARDPLSSSDETIR